MDPVVRRLLENKKRLNEDTDSPDDLYRSYLSKHRDGVRDTYKNIMLPILEDEGIENSILDKIEEAIEDHDASKDDPVEFIAYRNYFYDPEGHPRSHSEEFNQAWNHHQKCNPHHWQYWCLINDVDEPQVEPLDMPFEYIIEMLCDWQSAGNHYGNTAYDWYSQQKDKMMLSENTRNIVEKYIEYFK